MIACRASIEVKRDTFVPCALKAGHDGPHTRRSDHGGESVGEQGVVAGVASGEAQKASPADSLKVGGA